MKSLRAFEIVEFVEERKFCSIAELIDRFGVSPATIHRDIAALTAAGSIRKVHGGVASLSSVRAVVQNPDSMPSHYRDRMKLDMPAKEVIAEKALAEIRDGDTIFLDSSTTVYFLAKRLQQASFANLTIVTNSVLIIQEFPNFPANYFLVAMGGNYDVQLNAFLGQSTLREAALLKLDKSFISGIGLTRNGVFSRHENHTFLLHRILEQSDRNYLLMGSSNFGSAGLFSIAQLSSFSKIISDRELPAYAGHSKKHAADLQIPESGV